MKILFARSMWREKLRGKLHHSAPLFSRDLTLQRVTPYQWHKVCQHCDKLFGEAWVADGLQHEVQEEFTVEIDNVSRSEEEASESDSSQDWHF